MEDYYYNDGGTPENKSLKGYKVVVIVLAIILGILSFLYYSQVRELKAEFQIEKDTLTNQLSRMISDYDSLRVENDTINKNLVVERTKADSLLQVIQKERSINRKKIIEYDKKLTLMRGVLQGYVQTIDSLNTINYRLSSENKQYRTQAAALRLRAEKAEESATELTSKIRKGAVIKARDISLKPLNNADREVSRVNRAVRFRIDFTLSANELAQAGERNVYVRIIAPDGYVMSNPSNAVFGFEGDRLTYSATRSIDYQRVDLPVGLLYNGTSAQSGKYIVSVYMDGYLLGSNEVFLK